MMTLQTYIDGNGIRRDLRNSLGLFLRYIGVQNIGFVTMDGDIEPRHCFGLVYDESLKCCDLRCMDYSSLWYYRVIETDGREGKFPEFRIDGEIVYVWGFGIDRSRTDSDDFDLPPFTVSLATDPERVSDYPSDDLTDYTLLGLQYLFENGNATPCTGTETD